MTTERSQSIVLASDLEGHPEEENDSSLSLEETLIRLNLRISEFDGYRDGKVSLTGLSAIFRGIVPIRPTFISKIIDSAKKSGVVDYEEGGRNRLRSYFDRETILALGAAFWTIETAFRENGEFDASWDEIVRDTRDSLGEDNPIGLRLKYTNDPTLRYSSGETSHMIFTQGRKQVSEKSDDSSSGADWPRELTPDKIVQSLKSWDKERLQLLHDRIPNSVDSLDSLHSIKGVPDYFINYIMRVRDRLYGSESTVRRIEEYSIEAIVFKNALRDVIDLMERLGQSGTNLSLMDLSGKVMEMEYAGAA